MSSSQLSQMEVLHLTDLFFKIYLECAPNLFFKCYSGCAPKGFDASTDDMFVLVAKYFGVRLTELGIGEIPVFGIRERPVDRNLWKVRSDTICNVLESVYYGHRAFLTKPFSAQIFSVYESKKEEMERCCKEYGLSHFSTVTRVLYFCLLQHAITVFDEILDENNIVGKKRAEIKHIILHSRLVQQLFSKNKIPDSHLLMDPISSLGANYQRIKNLSEQEYCNLMLTRRVEEKHESEVAVTTPPSASSSSASASSASFFEPESPKRKSGTFSFLRCFKL